jgi:endogenous inhibitor of DNA gyrase (YacG/DUF329 family)
MAGVSEQNRKAVPCPICGKPTQEGHVPFCSKRCADVDLNRWLGGVYSIPTDERPDAAQPVPEEDD